MAGYPTRASLVSASTVVELTSLNTTKQDALYNAAIAAVEQFTRQSFAAPEGSTGSPVTKRLDGFDSDVVYMPRRLEQLVGITVNQAPWDVASVLLSDEHDRLTIFNPLFGSSWVTRAEHPMGPPITFRRGRGNIEVSGVWGWPSCPDPVATALRFDMEDQALAQANKLAGTVASARALGISSISQGGLSVNLSSGQPELSARAQRVLLDLVWEPTFGGMA